VPYVGGVFLALFYVMNVFGVWIWFEGVRRNKVPWKLSVMIPALLPLYINLSGGILLFLLMSFSLLSILRRQLLKTGLTIKMMGISPHDLSVLKLRITHQQ